MPNAKIIKDYYKDMVSFLMRPWRGGPLPEGIWCILINQSAQLIFQGNEANDCEKEEEEEEDRVQPKRKRRINDEDDTAVCACQFLIFDANLDLTQIYAATILHSILEGTQKKTHESSKKNRIKKLKVSLAAHT